MRKEVSFRKISTISTTSNSSRRGGEQRIRATRERERERDIYLFPRNEKNVSTARKRSRESPPSPFDDHPDRRFGGRKRGGRGTRPDINKRTCLSRVGARRVPRMLEHRCLSWSVPSSESARGK